MAVSKKKKSNKGIIGVVLILIVVIGIGAVPMISGMNSNGKYKSETVSKETIETYYSFTGSVSSKNSQKVMAEKIMQIAEVKVTEGTKVKKDDILFIAQDLTEVKAKISGTVSKIYIEEDEQVMSGTVLCDLYDFDHLEVTVKVDEYDLPAVVEGEEIGVTINALDKEIQGTIESVSDIATNQNGVAFFTAIVSLEYDSEVKIGMTAEATILNEKAEDVLTIPMKVLMFDRDNNPYINLKGEDGTMYKTIVVVGINDGKSVEIENGVKSGDTVYYLDEIESESSNSFAPPMAGR